MCKESELQAAIQKAKTRDIEAFEKLVNACQSSIRGFIAMLGVPLDSVDDLAQETFLAAYQGLPRFDASKPLLPWLRGIARNLVRQSNDRRKIGIELSTQLESEAVEDKSLRFQELYRLDYLLDCLKRLPTRSQSLIRLKYAEARNSFEIERTLNISAKTVRNTQARILIKLRRCVEGRMALEKP